MAAIFKEKYYLLFLTAVLLALALLPVLAVAWQVGDSWQGVPPSYIDGYYYYQRIKEVADGYPFLGNPYFWEHRLEPAPAFFFADWLAAWPMLLGGSMSFTLAFNLLLWSLFFGFTFYALLRRLGLPPGLSLAGAIWAYMVAYMMILRPVPMQQVFPFFTLFAWAFLGWWRQPTAKKQIILLIIATVLGFYVYTYLWQIALVWLGLAGLYLAIKKQWPALRALGISLAAIFILALPLIVYTVLQLNHPAYWESLARVGMVATHLPLFNAVKISVLMMAVMMFWWLASRFCPSFKADKFFNKSAKFFTFSGLAMIIVAFSNIVLGREMEISQHVEKFTVIWLVSAIGCFLFFIWRERRHLSLLVPWQKIVLFFLLAVCFVSSGHYFNFYFSPRAISKSLITDIKEIQAFAAPLEWLNKNEIEPKVIWADNNEFSKYVTILTKHYVLYDGNGTIHLLPSSELEERYLTAHYFDNLSLADIKQDIGSYGGVGNEFHQYKAHNRYVRFCRLLRLDLWGRNCGQMEDAYSFKGEAYFQNLFNRYHQEIKPFLKEKLDKFHVTYMIKDANYSSGFQPEKIAGAALVYRSPDQRFLIYKLFSQQ
jgi:hypothetical protein